MKRYINKGFVREYQVCSHCVMDTTDSKIVFDENGKIRNEKTHNFIYANFMIKKLKVEQYAKVCSALSKTCRLFCVGNG